MIKWIKTLFKIVREYESMVEASDRLAVVQGDVNILHANRCTNLEKRVDQVKNAVAKAEYAANMAAASEEFIRARTEVHANVNVRRGRPNSIIVVGRYKGRDFVEVFDVDSIEETVDHFRRMQRHHHRGIIDGPPSFSAFIDNEIKWKD